MKNSKLDALLKLGQDNRLAIGKLYCDAEKVLRPAAYAKLVSEGFRLLRTDAHEIELLKAAYRASLRV